MAENEAKNSDTAQLKVRKKIGNTGKTTIGILLTIILLFTAAVSILNYNVRHISKPDKLIESLDGVSLIEVIRENEGRRMDKFYDYMELRFKGTMTDETVADLLEESTILHRFAEAVSAFVDDFLEDGQAQLTISDRKLGMWMYENVEWLNRECKVNLNADDTVAMALQLLGASELYVDIGAVLEDVPAVTTIVKLFFSDTAMIIILGLSLVIAGLMIWNKPSKGLVGIGLALFFISAPGMLANLAAGSMATVWQSLFGTEVLATIAGNVVSEYLVLDIILLAAGIVLIVAGILVRRPREKQ